VVVADGTALQSGGEQQRTTDRISCISRRMFSLITLVLSLIGPFCAAIPVLHGCNLCHLLCAVIPSLSSHNCSKSVCSLNFAFLGTPDSNVHHRQCGGCVQYTQIWQKCWQLKICVSPIWDLCTSTFIIILQSDVSLNISWDFLFLARLAVNCFVQIML
jgi:hypothetical protein